MLSSKSYLKKHFKKKFFLYVVILDCLISMALVINGTTVVELPQLETYDFLRLGRTLLSSSSPPSFAFTLDVEEKRKTLPHASFFKAKHEAHQSTSRRKSFVVLDDNIKTPALIITKIKKSTNQKQSCPKTNGFLNSQKSSGRT